MDTTVTYARPELLQVADTVARDKGIDRDEVLEAMEQARTSAADFLLTAFHPLGTCRMAASPGGGVVGPDHQVFGLPGLYIADGSVVPSSVAVNPQVTIMALATRAADLLADRLDGTGTRAA